MLVRRHVSGVLHVTLAASLMIHSGCRGSSESATQINPTNYTQSSSSQTNTESNDWAYWRGPNRNGIAPSPQSPVTEWGEEKNVIWRTKLPGRGHGSPTIFGDHIYLAAGDAGTESLRLLCLHRLNGQMIWEKEIHRGGFRRNLHANNSHASGTVSCDGERLYAAFEHDGSIHVYVFNLAGELIWKRTVGQYKAHYPFGFGGSPLVCQAMVCVAGETDHGCLVAYRAADGREMWRVKQDFTYGYASPIVTTIEGRELLLMSGGNRVTAYDPLGGREIWSVPTKWRVACGTMVWDGNMVFASGGFPDQQTLGIDAVNGKLIWENGVKCYEQSLLAHNGYVYGISDRKIAYCWRAADGQEMWKERLISGSNRGGVSASPILANGMIYASVEDGTTFVFKADPTRFELIAQNQLGDSAFATPTIVDSKIYLRIGEKQQEWMYCIGQ
ncbi:MAG TPA: PQQ-binding-like beta-propeller repeat protein [Pirellulaceae bacterium]|nr:PQQ-binding-like beta-propeller repeat protein [Pirellulaceae bacterium]HMO91598.1 PQQ-binding-like beta-propeller repeat protein [Pirellulaceae bacterium]HMP68295.1 PQQ-binding-like beta-propeller repeat protein [Pirellulaceae bacterium]